MIRIQSQIVSLIACVLLPALLCSLTFAQGLVEGYAVVKSDGTVLRCGDMPRFYRVMDLSAGSVVRTLGAADGWTQVVYPNGSTAYVEADRVESINSKTVRLTKASGLLAPSALLGASGSWCPLFAEPLPVGTTLKVVEEITGIGGTVTKYLVEAPQPPVSTSPSRGFVRSDELRAATASEIEAVQRLTGQGENESADTGGDIDPVDPGAGSGDPATESPLTDPEDEGLDTSLLDPIETGPLDPATEPVEPAIATGPETDPVDQTTLATNTGGTAQVPVVPTQQEIIALTVNELNAAFADLQNMSRDDADAAFEEMVAECRRTADKLASEPELVQAVNQRLEWLQLRIKLRDQRRALDQTLEQANQRQRAISLQVSEWRQGRSFTVIGRVLRSSLYNGERLPLMYRIESVEGPGFGRTTAYLRGDDERDFARFVGGIVGIVGNTQYDDALGVRIITADRVEALDQP